MIRRTISATLFVDGTKFNTVPGLSKTVSLGPTEQKSIIKFGKMVKTVTCEATGHCVACYGILQRNHNVLWATNITNYYIHVPDCRDFIDSFIDSPGCVAVSYTRSMPI